MMNPLLEDQGDWVLLTDAAPGTGMGGIRYGERAELFRIADFMIDRGIADEAAVVRREDLDGLSR